MSSEEMSRAVGQSADQLRKELLQDDEFARRWRESGPRRRLSHGLISMRKSADLTQRHVAEAAGWDQAQVARMESATGPWPRPESVRAYAEVCGFSAGYVFAHATGKTVHIDGAVSFGSSASDLMLERLVDADVKV